MPTVGKAIKVGDEIWANLIDSKIKEYVNYQVVTTYADGSAMTDDKVDGIVYRKRGSEYLRRVYQGAVNVQWFGATGDGVADDTAALNAAFNAGFATQLYVPKGNYRITSSVTINGNKFIKGEDIHNTQIIIDAPNSTPVYVGTIAMEVDKSYGISGLTLDCNGNSGGLFFETAREGSGVVKDLIIDNVIVRNAITVGDYKYSIHDVNTTRNNIHIKRYAGISIENVLISNVICEGAPGDGNYQGDNLLIGSYGVDGIGTLQKVNIVNCMFSKSGRQNISLAGDIASSEHTDVIPDDINIVNCIFEDSGLAGIDCELARNVNVSNCHFRRSATYSGFYDGSHVAQTTPNTAMRGGVSLHQHEQINLSNCTFIDCYSAVAGNGHQPKFSNCVFDNSPLNKLDGAGGYEAFASSCHFKNTHILSYNKDMVFSACKFENVELRLTTSTQTPVFSITASKLENVYCSSFQAFNLKITDSKVINCDRLILQTATPSGGGRVDILNSMISECPHLLQTFDRHQLATSVIGCEIVQVSTAASTFLTTYRTDLLTFQRNKVKILADDNTVFIDCWNEHKSLNISGNTFTSTSTTPKGKVIQTRSKIIAGSYLVEQEIINNNNFENFDQCINLTQTSTFYGKCYEVQGNTYSNCNKLLNDDFLNHPIPGAIKIVNNERSFGTTAERPSSGVPIYKKYYDTTLKVSIVWNGTAWVDNQGFTPAIKSGTTSNRPTLNSTTDKGFTYFDTSINKLIIWNGTAWVDSVGASV